MINFLFNLCYKIKSHLIVQNSEKYPNIKRLEKTQKISKSSHLRRLNQQMFDICVWKTAKMIKHLLLN